MINPDKMLLFSGQLKARILSTLHLINSFLHCLRAKKQLHCSQPIRIETFFINMIRYNTSSYIIYGGNTYKTNITIHLHTQLRNTTQLLYITYNTYMILCIVFAFNLHFLQHWIPSIFPTFNALDAYFNGRIKSKEGNKSKTNKT